MQEQKAHIKLLKVEFDFISLIKDCKMCSEGIYEYRDRFI